MNIHTTQNLISRARRQSTDNVTIPEIRLNYSEQMRKQNILNQADSFEGGVSFKGKKEIVKKIVDNSRKAADKETRMDKFLKSRFFDKTLNIMNHEVLVQSLISAVVCVAMRPLTIMAIPTKKSKQDNMYASAHSVSSGLVGIASSLLIATPFSKGIKYAQKTYLKDMSENLLKRKYPNLNIESIWADAAKTVRKPVSEWTDVLGNKFSKEYKDVMKVAQPKHISEISEATLKDFGADVDVNAMKGKPISEWTDRNGKKLHFELKDMFIAVKEEGMGGSLKSNKDTNFFSLAHIDKDFLKEVMPKLDINSIEKDGKRLHTDMWKNVDGTPFKLDMDMVHLSSYRETAHATPLYTGKKRIETKGGKTTEKYVSYQNNVKLEDSTKVPEKLGSAIEQEYLNKDKVNVISNKTFGWLPDILTRIPVAAGTIYLIPFILKNVFHIEKSKKHEEKQDNAIKAEVNNSHQKTENKPAQVTFKGKKESAFGRWISEFYGKHYGKKVMNSEKIQNVSEKLSKIPGEMTEHMATLGSILTSATYMYKTLNNKDLDSDKRKTLAVNQGLCCVIPTIGAYTVSKLLSKFRKNAEYKYCGLKEQQIALGQISKEEAKELKKTFGNKLQGFNALTQLITFTLIYRYVTPVVITPIANWIGRKLNGEDKKDEQKVAENQQNNAQEIKMTEQKELKKAV